MPTPLDYARDYVRAGISVLPVRCDGTKQPLGSWKRWTETIPSQADVERMFGGKVGIGAINGRVSGNKETIDIDAPELMEPFEAAVEELAPGLLTSLPTVATPRNNWGGRHYHLRIEGTVAGNTKLAQSELRPQFNADGTPEIDPRTGKQRLAPETLIETRGEGGFVIAPGSPPKCHETGLEYKHISGPPITETPVISAEHHRILWSVARSFNRYVDDRDVQGGPTSRQDGKSPGDDFAARTSWDDILLPGGWTKGRSSGDLTFWCRPGKSRGVSATTGARSAAGTELLCVFSSNAHPFEGPSNGRLCKSYSKFAAYAVLHHNGNFSGAARDLAAKGFGTPNVKKSSATPAQKIRLPEPFVPFPTPALPLPLRNFVQEAATAIGCDETLVALPLLAALAGCIGSTRRLRIKRGWYAPAVLWTAPVVDSGQHKSPAQGAVTRLLYERQGRDLDEHANRILEFQKTLNAYERELTDWKRKKGGRGAPPEKPEEPVCKRILVSDTTIEAVADRLQDNQRGLLVDRDELSGWLGSYDQYRSGKGSDVSHWLSCYNAKPLLIDRKTSARKTIYVERAAVSVTGGIQPRILARLLGKQHFENGLAARFGFGMPPKTTKRWSEANISDDSEEALEWIYDVLLGLKFRTNVDGKAAPIDFGFTADGKEAFIEFYNEHGREQDELTGDLGALWAKLEEVAARIALITHLVRCSIDDRSLATPDAVDAASVATGVALARWFGNEGRRIYGVLAETDEERDRRLLIERIERKGGRISIRDLCRNSRRYASADLAEAVLNGLVQAGFGRWEVIPPPIGGGSASREMVLLSDGRADTRLSVSDGNGASVGVGANQQPNCELGDKDDQEDIEWTF